MYPLSNFQTSKYLYLMILTFQQIWKILQIAHLKANINSPWLEYKKWYITSWYTVKPDFCQILPDFSRKNRILKTGYPIQKFIVVKTYLGQGEYYLRISAKSVKYYPKIRNFFGLKPFRDQDGAKRIKFS